MEKTFGFLKDCFEKICSGWSNTSTGDLHVDDVQMSNNSYISAVDAAGTGTVDIIKVNTGDEVEIDSGTLIRDSITTQVQKYAPSGASSASFSIVAGGIYRISWSLSGDLGRVRFNSDATATNYGWQLHMVTSTGGYTNSDSDQSDDRIRISYDNVTVSSSVGEMVLSTGVGDTTFAFVRGISSAVTSYSVASSHNYSFSGVYNGGSAVATVQLLPDSGTITGTVICERVG